VEGVAKQKIRRLSSKLSLIKSQMENDHSEALSEELIESAQSMGEDSLSRDEEATEDLKTESIMMMEQKAPSPRNNITYIKKELRES
jgi:uncharacterized membrane-anchored protein YjiN (DUF445 family)